MFLRLVAVLALVLPVLAAQPASAREEPTLSSITAAERDTAPGTDACFPGMAPGQTQIVACEYGTRGPHVVALGDSHMRALSPALRRLAEEGTLRLTLITRSRCGWTSRPLEHDLGWVGPDCQAWRADVQRYLREHDDIRAIVTSHRGWTMPGRESERGPDTVRAWRVALERRIPVIAISGAANWDADFMPTACLRSHRTPDEWDACAAPRDEVMGFDWTEPAVELARREFGSRSAFRIDMDAVYCPKDRCRVVTPGGQIMYRDDEHLTATYTRSLASFFERRLRATGVVFLDPADALRPASGVLPTRAD